MLAYIYRAACYCQDCGEAIKKEIAERRPELVPVDPDNESSFDSDTYPKGPYPDGSGESDTPQHCDRCHIHLENPLTGDGETYVRDAFGEYVETGRGSLEVLQDWKAGYDWVWDDFESITLEGMIEEKPLTPAQENRLVELK